MTLRTRIGALVAAVVGATLLLSAVICFVAMRSELRSQVDSALRTQAQLIQRAARGFPATSLRQLPAPPPRQGGAAGYGQIIEQRDDQLHRLRTFGVKAIPIRAGDTAVVRARVRSRIDDRRVDGVHARVYTFSIGDGTALQLGRSLTSVDSTLSRLRAVLVALWVIGTALAAGAARVLSRRALAPLTRVTDAAEHIESTGDLGRRVPVGTRSDEPGRLAQRFNAMLDRLQTAQSAQRQLIADASHELRTPVAALRTNVELLAETPALTDGQRAAIAADANHQAEELSTLVADVIELARGDEQPLSSEDIALDDLALEAVERGRRHSTEHRFTLDVCEPAVIMGDPARLARAFNNLIDNAIKYAPDGTDIDVSVDGARVTVRDRGPGIAEEDLPHVFDRFYRGSQARSVIGSGLGLAIVRQIVDAHGGAVALEPAPGGGTRVAVTLAAVATTSHSGPGEELLRNSSTQLRTL